MTDTEEITPADELAAARELSELMLRRLGELLNRQIELVRDAPDPASMSKRAAGRELKDLAELNNEVRLVQSQVAKLDKLLSGDDGLKKRVEARMYYLAIQAEEQAVIAGGYTFTPTMHTRSVKPADGLTWESPEMHDALRAYGMGAIIKTTLAQQTVKSAIEDYRREHGLGDTDPLPEVFIPQLDEHGDPVIDAATGEVMGRTVNLGTMVVPNEIPSVTRKKR